MNRNQDLRHNFQPPIKDFIVQHENVHYKRVNLIALFFVQVNIYRFILCGFLLSLNTGIKVIINVKN